MENFSKVNLIRLNILFTYLFIFTLSAVYSLSHTHTHIQACSKQHSGYNKDNYDTILIHSISERKMSALGKGLMKIKTNPPERKWKIIII
jgi:hypothetical protein